MIVSSLAPFNSDSLTASLAFNAAGTYKYFIGRRRRSGLWLPVEAEITVSMPGASIEDCLDADSFVDGTVVNLDVETG